LVQHAGVCDPNQGRISEWLKDFRKSFVPCADTS
jgi:hypothetical protein